uniref:Uncharacterized protein n=1 Tax=Anguilla anguilla TaxID=7936 RepID=A0A0E9UFA9_ANGAN
MSKVLMTNCLCFLNPHLCGNLLCVFLWRCRPKQRFGKCRKPLGLDVWLISCIYCTVCACLTTSPGNSNLLP